MDAEHVEAILEVVRDRLYDYDQFRDAVAKYLLNHPDLNNGTPRHVHSVKSRLKDIDHIKSKIVRKSKPGNEIAPDNVLNVIKDIAGVRVLHLIQASFVPIYTVIKKKVERGDWVFAEPPKALTWDRESEAFFKDCQIETEFRETHYTSVHFIIKERETSPVCCELQVRTLFEEIWGEIDHTINYPENTHSVACREQIRVLSKLIATGSRLSDSIFRSYEEHKQKSTNTSQVGS